MRIVESFTEPAAKCNCGLIVAFKSIEANKQVACPKCGHHIKLSPNFLLTSSLHPIQDVEDNDVRPTLFDCPAPTSLIDPDNTRLAEIPQQ